MMLKQNMRRGLNVDLSRRRGRGRFAVAFACILVLLAALLWQFRAPLKDVVAQFMPPRPPTPEASPPPPAGPVPGVDRIARTSQAEGDESVVRAPGPSSAARPSVGTDVSPVPKVVQVSSSPGNGPGEVTIARPAMPEASPVPESGGSASPRRAVPAEAPPAATEVRSARAPEPSVPENPLTTSPQNLVEVGRSHPGADSKSTQSLPTPAQVLGASPSIKDVPPACKPALEGLKSFLNARNWHERLKYIQLSKQMADKVERYYSASPDGPIDVDEIAHLRHDENPEVGHGLHAVFVLSSRNWGYSVPVMVEVNEEGARVDWLTFIEFKDDMLNKYMRDYMEGPVQFHVAIHRTHYFDEGIPGLDQKDHFAISTPMQNFRAFAFVPKGTTFARSLANTISWEKEDSFVVVELQWRKEGNAKWVEMIDLPQLNWYSAPAPEAPPPPADDPTPVKRATPVSGKGAKARSS